jgi:hypothetical protein
MKIQYDFFFFSFERLGRMHKNKKFFFVKTRYFNTGFVSLRYKIQTDINQNGVEKYTGKSQIFQNDF